MANAIGVLAYFSVTMGLCTAAVAYGNNMTFWDSQRAKCTHFFPFVFDQSQYKYGVLALALAISTACYLMFLRAYNVRLCSPPPPHPPRHPWPCSPMRCTSHSTTPCSTLGIAKTLARTHKLSAQALWLPSLCGPYRLLFSG